jgi:hypothetical protein
MHSIGRNGEARPAKPERSERRQATLQTDSNVKQWFQIERNSFAEGIDGISRREPVGQIGCGKIQSVRGLDRISTAALPMPRTTLKNLV